MSTHMFSWRNEKYFPDTPPIRSDDRRVFTEEKKYSRLSLSRIPRDSLKYFEISVPRHIRVERVQKTIN